jgi:hypothetical protein
MAVTRPSAVQMDSTEDALQPPSAGLCREQPIPPGTRTPSRYGIMGNVVLPPLN